VVLGMEVPCGVQGRSPSRKSGDEVSSSWRFFA